MTMWVVIVIVVCTVLFILADVWKGRKSSFTNTVRTASIETIHRETERLVRLENEVDGKLLEIRRLEVATAPTPDAPLQDALPASIIEAAPAARDPMNDTRCMQTVREKADEFEREVRKRSG